MIVTPIGANTSTSAAGNQDNQISPSDIIPDNAALQCFYLREVLRDGPGPATCDIASLKTEKSDLVFASRPPSMFCAGYISADHMDLQVAESVSITSTTDLANENFKVNLTDTWPRGFAVSYDLSDPVSLSLKSDPSDDAEELLAIQTRGRWFFLMNFLFSHECSGTQLLASKEDGDWLYVQLLVPPNHTNKGVLRY
jgi:hypothetical protein